MGWRFRKSFTPLPGVRLTLSPSGVTTSIGAGPFRISGGPQGAALTTNVLGTGRSYRHTLRERPPLQVRPPAPSAPVSPPSVPVQAELQEIRSGGSGAMTTQGLAEHKRLLERSKSELSDIGRELEAAIAAERRRDVGRHARWEADWFFRRLLGPPDVELRWPVNLEWCLGRVQGKADPAWHADCIECKGDDDLARDHPDFVRVCDAVGAWAMC